MSTRNPHGGGPRRGNAPHGRARRFARFADAVAGLTDPSMGDERERDVILRAGTAAMTAALFTFIALGLLLAATGAVLQSGLAILASAVPNFVYFRYCSSEGLDNAQVYSRTAPRRRRLTMAIGAICALVWLGLLAAYAITGAPLIDLSWATTRMESTSTWTGALVGGVAGVAATFAVLGLLVRSGRRRTELERTAPDED
ncbi:hypothetical protein [Brevibacterium album]|uniref:hypothetical protein n=1 Tax=Brevibacterium album TaxID=417948 RepID=UPI00041C2A38|nr:hypothetical protein [Brevibacterium album]